MDRLVSSCFQFFFLEFGLWSLIASEGCNPLYLSCYLMEVYIIKRYVICILSKKNHVKYLDCPHVLTENVAWPSTSTENITCMIVSVVIPFDKAQIVKKMD